MSIDLSQLRSVWMCTERDIELMNSIPFGEITKKCMAFTQEKPEQLRTDGSVDGEKWKCAMSMHACVGSLGWSHWCLRFGAFFNIITIGIYLYRPLLSLFRFMKNFTPSTIPIKLVKCDAFFKSNELLYWLQIFSVDKKVWKRPVDDPT